MQTIRIATLIPAWEVVSSTGPRPRRGQAKGATIKMRRGVSMKGIVTIIAELPSEWSGGNLMRIHMPPLPRLVPVGHRAMANG